MNEHLLETCALAALAGLCANPNHPPNKHPTNGDVDAVTSRALALGKAMAEKLAAAPSSAAPADEPPSEPPKKKR